MLRSYNEGCLYLELVGRVSAYPVSKDHLRFYLQRYEFEELSTDVFANRSTVSSDGIVANAYQYSINYGWLSLHNDQGHIDLNLINCKYENGE